MKLSACFVLLACSLVFVRSEDEKKYDLANKDQFTFFFKDNWETMFNTPAPLAMAAKANIVSVLADPMYYAPCYIMAREKNGKEFFQGRLWGMHHAIQHCSVDASKVLPVDLSQNKAEGLLNMQFTQNMSYKSYTNKFDSMSMHIKARKSGPAEPFRIYHIEDHCDFN